MEKFLYDKIIQAADILNQIIGYVDGQNNLKSFRQNSFTVISGVEFGKNRQKKHLENKITSECHNVKEQPQQKGATNDIMKYKGISILWKADGRYWARYRLNGKQHPVYGKTQLECYNNLKAAFKNPKPKETVKRFTLIEWLYFWYETYKKPYIKSTAIYRQIKNHVIGDVKNIPISKITTLDLQLMINKIETTRTRLDVTILIKSAFSMAVQAKIIKENPASGLAKVNHKQKRGAALTLDEEKDFLNRLSGHKLENLLKYYMLSGCRRSEALSLNTADIDFKNKTLKIHGTKTESSERIIPLFTKLEELIRSMTPDENGFYFILHPQTVTHAFKDLCPNHKLHDLRHTFATRALEAGVSMKTVQIWLGHRDFETTANVYSHTQKDYLQEQAFRLNSYLDTHFDTQKSENLD